MGRMWVLMLRLGRLAGQKLALRCRRRTRREGAGWNLGRKGSCSSKGGICLVLLPLC